MNGFVVAYTPTNDVPAQIRFDVLVSEARRRGIFTQEPERIGEPSFAALTWREQGSASLVARRGDLVAIGAARLDNRAEIDVACGNDGGNRSDLDVIVSAYARHGDAVIDRLHGDFGFVIWNAATRRLVAARDAMGIKRLFWRAHGDGVVIGSGLDVVSDGVAPDDVFVASYLTGHRRRDPTSTIWSDTNVVSAGTFIAFHDGRQSVHRYWTAGQGCAAVPGDEREQCEIFYTHFRRGVQSCLTDSAAPWSELSGGLDSASVLAVAEELYADGATPTRVAGTYSFVDDMAGADQRAFLDTLLERFSIRNERIANPYPWQDDGEPPPRTDEPRVYYPFWARDRRAERIVRESGSHVVLSGAGSDQYVTGNPLFIADLLARLRIGAAVAESHAIATAVRRSLWEIFWHYGVRPLLTRRHGRAPEFSAGSATWIAPAFAERVRSRERDSAYERAAVAHDRFTQSGVSQVDAAPGMHEIPLTSPTIEKRYPFFYRPLIDFVLALPPNMLFRDVSNKWIQREAMRGRVPEAVRSRVSKGWIDGRICWALEERHALISKLLRDPLIAQAGWVDAAELRDAVDRARSGRLRGTGGLMRALSLETWLVVRSGRWPEMTR